MPKSESLIFIWRRSMARMVSFFIGISYCLPLRLSVIDSVSRRPVAGVSLVETAAGLVGFIPEPLERQWEKAQPSAHLPLYTKFRRERGGIRWRAGNVTVCFPYGTVWKGWDFDICHIYQRVTLAVGCRAAMAFLVT